MRGLGEGGDDQAQRGQEQAQAGQHDPAAVESGQRQLGEGPHRQQQEHDGPLDGVAVLVQHVAEEGGRQRGEQPEQGEGGEPGHAGGDELAPAQLGDAQTGEAQGGPAAWPHRLGDEEQAQARGRQHRQVHLEHQDRGVGSRTGRTARR